MKKQSPREEAEVSQERRYQFSDLQEEMKGYSIGRLSFSGALRQTLGDKKAVEWFYQTRVPDLKGQTPHEYVEKRGEEGKKSLAASVYHLLAGQPD